MPVPPGAKTGYDYSATRQVHNSSDLQRKDNNTWQTIRNLIDGAEKFQGFVDNQFPQLDGSTSSLLNAVQEIQAVLQDRQNSKYTLSITNSEAISIPPFEETQVSFDTDELNDGLMHWKPDEVRVNDNAAWQIYGRVVACIPAKALLKIIVKVNGEPQIPSMITGAGKTCFPFIGTKELLRNDIVTLHITHTADSEIEVLPTLQMHRLSWVANDNASGRRVSSTADDNVCADTFGDNLDDCICTNTGVSFAVLPQSKSLYILNKAAKIIGQTLPPATEKAITFCPTRKGTFYVAIDDTASGFTRIEEYDTKGALVSSKVLTVKIGQGPVSAAHSLRELPCNFLLSVVRSTHQVIEYDLGANITSRLLDLTIDPFDFDVNSEGNKIVYANGNILSAYDVVGDQTLTDIKDFGFPIFCPTWLKDCSVIISSAPYLGNGDFRRVDLDGNDAGPGTYTYDTTVFPGGLLGYAASVSRDRLWIVGLMTNNVVGTIILNLTDGSVVIDDEVLIEPVTWFFGPTVVNETAMVSAIYTAVKCTVE